MIKGQTALEEGETFSDEYQNIKENTVYEIQNAEGDVNQDDRDTDRLQAQIIYDLNIMKNHREQI